MAFVGEAVAVALGAGFVGRDEERGDTFGAVGPADDAAAEEDAAGAAFAAAASSASRWALALACSCNAFARGVVARRTNWELAAAEPEVRRRLRGPCTHGVGWQLIGAGAGAA